MEMALGLCALWHFCQVLSWCFNLVKYGIENAFTLLNLGNYTGMQGWL